MLKFSGKNIAYVRWIKLPVDICVLEEKKTKQKTKQSMYSSHS